ncbi:expressed unknown protein [Seminavis robusta]|uniref:Fungal lipase-type domain-containing protein n=1 Tax=Seminavis robusta TaxID=568900 RepID=A0A9N8DVX9_9STRA|nr:expressed unknown protein [Seminavis robusta]|eukprot:Sro315_g115370.1 n/a (442) ;mRNA; r:56870-58349
MKNDNRLLENSTIDRDHWIFHTEPSNDWLNAGRNPQCTSEAQNSIRNPSTILNEEFLRKAYISEYLSGTVCYDGGLLNNLPKYQDLYEHFMAWDDGVDDVTVMAKIEGMCYVAFRGTSYFNINDLVFQNLNPTVANVGDTNCYIRKGYYDAYYTPYVNDFERRMQLCLNSCKGGTCPLVITGGSQGAGPAVVASIVYRHLDPTVITWGGVRALYRISPIDASVCQDVNPQNHYRFVITDSTLRLIDFIPYQWAFFSQQIGHEILFDGNDMNYMGINNPVKRNPLTYSLLVHSPCNYDAKTRQLYENSCFPVPASGWKDGHWCKTDEDCESAFCTDLGFCNAGFDAGERCRRDEQCVSKTCIQSVSECAPYHGKMNEGMHCRDDEDCASGRCEQGLFGWLPLVDSVCAPQLDTGEECNEDSDCKSNVCGGFLLWGRRCWPQD